MNTRSSPIKIQIKLRGDIHTLRLNPSSTKTENIKICKQMRRLIMICTVYPSNSLKLNVMFLKFADVNFVVCLLRLIKNSCKNMNESFPGFNRLMYKIWQ